MCVWEGEWEGEGEGERGTLPPDTRPTFIDIRHPTNCSHKPPWALGEPSSQLRNHDFCPAAYREGWLIAFKKLMTTLWFTDSNFYPSDSSRSSSSDQSLPVHPSLTTSVISSTKRSCLDRYWSDLFLPQLQQHTAVNLGDRVQLFVGNPIVMWWSIRVSRNWSGGISIFSSASTTSLSLTAYCTGQKRRANHHFTIILCLICFLI